MKIKQLYAENLYSYEKLEFDFDKYPGGTTLLLGRNLDQKTANGAGKSGIMKALYFCFYGEDVAGANKADVLKRGSKRGYYVTIEFEDRGHSFKIERFEGRKDKSSSGKGLNFYIDGALFNGEGGIEETQSIINQKIRITPRLFLSSVYAAQDSKNNFLLESDTKKKELLSELLDLQVYQKAFKYVKDAIDEVEGRKKDKENKIESLNDQIKTLEEEVKSLITKRDTFKIENKEKLRKEELKLAEVTKKLSKIRENKKNFDLKSIQETIANLKTEREKVNNELKTEQQIEVAYVKLDGAVDELKNKNSDISDNIQSLEKENVELDSISYDQEAHEEIKSKISHLESLISDLEKEKDELAKLTLEINTMENQAKNYQDKIDSLAREIKKLEESENCPTCLRPYEESHLEHVKNSIKQLETEKMAIESNKVSLSSQLNEVRDQFNKMTLNLKKMPSLKEEVKNVIKQNESFNLVLEKMKIKNEQKQKNLEKIEAAKKDLLDKSQKIESFKEKRKSLDKLMAELEPFKKRSEEIESSLEVLTQQERSAELEEQEINQLNANKQNLEVEEMDLKDSVQEIRTANNPYSDTIVNLEKRSTAFLAKIKEHKSLIEKDTDHLKYLGFWSIGFAPTGIRSFITDDVIDLINKNVQNNLNDLFDGALSVFFDPESKNNKGVTSNKISTNFYLNGKLTAKESLSGGELRRAILATELALTEIAESRSGNKLNIRFLDEPFNGMDSNGQLQAFKLFARLSKDKDGFFVISHDENFQSMCPNVVYILKKDETSRIVDKNTYNQYHIDSDQPTAAAAVSNNIIEDSTKTKQEMLAERLKQIAAKNKNDTQKE